MTKGWRAQCCAGAILLCGCDALGGGGQSTETTASASAETTTSATTASTSSATSSASASGSAEAAPPKADPSRLKLDGKAIQGGLVKAKVDKGTRGIKFPGHRVVISDEGEFLIAFYRNAPEKETLTVTFPDGAVLEHVFSVEQRTYEDDRIDGMPEKWVRPPPEMRKKNAAYQKRIKAIRMRYTKTPHYAEGFIWPAKGRLTSRYGQKRFFNGVDGGIHWGIDIAVPVGTPVKAPAGGTVVFAETNVPLAGHTLILDHGRGLSSSFLHLAGFSKKVGDEVKQGDVIGTVGMTGRTNGAHLDWRMNLFETRIDPELLVGEMKD